MDADEPTTRWDTGRIEAFSDGVFAIVITLLAFQLDAPSVGPGESIIGAIWKMWPSIFAFVLSFVIVGLIWISHHDLYRYLQRANHRLQMLNLGSLLVIAFIPFPTHILSRHLGTPRAQEAVLIYSGWLFVSSILLNIPWWYMARRRDYFGLPFDRRSVRRASLMYGAAPLLYLTSMALSQVSVVLALALYVLPVIVFLFPSPLGEGAESSTLIAEKP